MEMLKRLMRAETLHSHDPISRSLAEGLMKRRVAIIGTGWVGSSVAISTLHSGAADEVLLNDARPGVAEGEAMDLVHGGPFYPAAAVRTAAIEEMVDADAVVVT